MQLHELTGSHKRAKRIARGGKRGTTAGRGQKGQKSRSGHRIRPASRDLIMRIPKRRGYKNKQKAPKAAIIGLERLARALRPLAEKGKPVVVTPDLLRERGVLPVAYYGPVKVLGAGPVPFPIVLKGIAASKQARAALGAREAGTAKRTS
jgi:large subunit ribosomal protein L15